jgi:diketogulonate reductase-like aldo/keto reductase
MSTVPTLTLNNGVTIPQFGLGVWQAQDGAEVERAIAAAFESGYRLIDTAAIYGNEQGVGNAIKASGLKRDEIFLTTKLWNSDQGYDSTLRAFDASIERLGVDYVDMYLIHWPMPKVGKFVDTWKAFEKLYADKRIRAIGVSNFTVPHLEALLAQAEIVPAVDQIELHPRLSQPEIRAYCEAHDIKVESYSPIMHGGEVLEDPVIKRIAEAHGKSPAQVVLRWHIQHGLIVIPKSVNPERIRENIAIFDFELALEEMEVIDAMNTNTRVGADPDTFNSGAAF